MSTYDEALQHLRRFAVAYPEHRGFVETVTRDVNALEGERRAAVAELEVSADRVHQLEIQVARLEAALALATAPPNPDLGAEQVWALQPGVSLASTLAAMALGNVTPGGVSVLHVPGANLGPLECDHHHQALLKGRTLRLVGPPTARIKGDPAVSLDASAGDCAGFALELWSVGVLGNIVVRDQPGFMLRPTRGSAMRAQNAEPIGTGVPVGN